MEIFTLGVIRLVTPAMDSMKKHGFTEKFAAENIGIMHISFLKIWVTIFMKRLVSISSFPFNDVLYSFGQHSLDLDSVPGSSSQWFCIVPFKS